MSYRAVLLAALTLAGPCTALAADAGTVPEADRDRTRCARVRAMPWWCREERERERDAQRVCVREARHHAAGRHLEALLRRTLPARDLEAAGDLSRVALEDAVHLRSAHRAAATGGPGRRLGVSIHLAGAPPPLAASLAA